ncbi:MAG TPA: hypothetical protein VJ852_10860 [Gemmatimonadaceae bacterium]|nr:hypothetical protein [Gemmatimonadaceae bacterium]
MSDGSRFMRLRAALRNAVVWGVGWGAIGSAIATTMRFVQKVPLGNAILDGLGMGVRIAFIGALAGAAFFGFITLAYRGKRLREISWIRFGVGGAILAGLFVPAFLQTMNLVTGGSLVPWSLVFDDLVFSAAFGGITAAGTMLMAQRYEAKHPVTVQELLERMERQTLDAAAAVQFRKPERTRSAEQL